MTIYLGVDYGRQHLGIAIADGPLARPLTSIHADFLSSLPQIATLAASQEVDVIVVGMPEGVLAPEVKRFGAKLGELTGKTVVYHPETLTTREALIKLQQSGASQSKKRDEHLYAACLILEDYLESAKLVRAPEAV